MTDKELIKQEIEIRIKEGSSKNDISEGALELDSLLDFIDSLTEEHGCEVNFTTNEELEKEFNRFLDNVEGTPRMWHSDEQMEWGMDIARHFAEWQKDKMKETLQTEYEKGRFDMREEMMKNTVLETEVLMDCDGDGIETPYEEWLTLEDTEIPCVPDSFKDGDIVKVVLIKEDLP